MGDGALKPCGDWDWGPQRHTRTLHYVYGMHTTSMYSFLLVRILLDPDVVWAGLSPLALLLHGVNSAM